ncbi:histone H1-like [Anolis carolinensis]|uniref:histone H1-like n=1 Tax=Anolis carolinensis TaxID=28377 RepID=UPI002F2B1B78
MVNGKPQQGGADGDEASTSAPDPKKKGKPARASGSLSQLILQAFEACHPRKSLSLAALKKFVSEAGYNVSKNNSRLKRELRQLVSNGLLLRVTGTGASGSFRAGGPRAKKTGGGGNKQRKKARKKQPAVNKPKGLRGRPSGAAPARRRQLNKRPASRQRAR